MPDGRQQEPGGWNRTVLQVQNLPVRIAELEIDLIITMQLYSGQLP
jgi:hypothetical protein